jgi:hypothetical protein
MSQIIATASSVCQCIPSIKNGHTWNLWIGEHFGDCIYTPGEYASFGLGILTLILNIVSLCPQIWLNYKNKKTDGLSLGLLLIWVVADIFALGGSILTGQLMTQVVLALYFIIVDAVTIFQCWYYTPNPHTDSLKESGVEYTSNIPLGTYTIIHPQTRPQQQQQQQLVADGGNYGFVNEFSNTSFNPNLEEELLNTKNNSPLLEPTSEELTPISDDLISQPKTSQSLLSMTSAVAVITFISLVALFNISSSSSSSTLVDSNTAMSAIETIPATFPTSLDLPLCLTPPTTNPQAIYFGVLISWVSGFLYCASRAPQIKSNYEFYKLNIPLDGLSPSVFIVTALGNVCYGASVMLRNTIDAEFWVKTFPFLIGSLGTIVFDIVILAQIYYYNKQFEKRATLFSSQYGEDEL